MHIVSQNKPGAIHTSGHSPGPAELGLWPAGDSLAVIRSISSFVGAGSSMRASSAFSRAGAQLKDTPALCYNALLAGPRPLE